MSDSVRASVEVAVLPEVAFDVFTREIDAWYRVDKDTLPDITRTAAIRFEPWLGGRLLDVHDSDSGEGRELGRITDWEPGHRLAFIDNEGTEVEVSFERLGVGTRVTLTHRGLDRVSSKRAAQLRRKGWAALAPFYRDHVAPNARPAAIAAASLAPFAVLSGCGIWIVPELAREHPGAVGVAIWVVWALCGCGILVAWSAAQDRLVPRWLRSRWQYDRMLSLAFVLVSSGLLLWALHSTIKHGEDPASIGILLVVLVSAVLDARKRPATDRNTQEQAPTVTPISHKIHPGHWIVAFVSRYPSLSRHPSLRLYLLLIGAIALGSALAMISMLGLPVLYALLALLGVYSLRSVIAERQRSRHRKALGYDPDYYLSVERRVSEQGRRPEVLIHEPSGHPEFSGWWAFASEQNRGPEDFVTWTVHKLVDHSPEVALPLRQGHGKWKWNDTENAYQPI